MATRVLALGRRQIKILLFLPGKVICIASLNVRETLDSESIKHQHIALKNRNGAHDMADSTPLPSADISSTRLTHLHSDH